TVSETATATATAIATATRTATSTRTTAPVAPSVEPRTSVAVGDNFGRAIGMIAASAMKQTFAQLGIAAGHGHSAADTGRVGLLIKVLESDTDAEVRRAAAWGLADIQTTSSASALVHALQSDADDRVREMAAWAIGEQGGGLVGSAALG